MALSAKELKKIEEAEKLEEKEIADYLKKEKEEDKERELELKTKEIANAKAAVVRENERMKEKLAKIKEEPKRKEKMSDRAQKYLFIAMGVVFISILIVFAIASFPKDELKSDVVALPTCGDGTFYGKCSLSKPYFCTEGQLVANSILCGCPDELRKDEGVCVSKYFIEPEEVTLIYNLRGEEKFIPFTVYSGVQQYLDSLSRELWYDKGEIPRRDDFKLMKIEDELQREILLPLIMEIRNAAPNSSVDQLRIAVSMVQNIVYGESEFTGDSLYTGIRLSRYPYQVISEGMGSCEGKSELLTLILRELGYDSAMFYYRTENHEAVGIKCPVEYSLGGTGYCFVETTVPAPMTYSTGTYLGISTGKLMSSPEVILLNKGKELPADMYEFEDAKKLDSILDNNAISVLEKSDLEELSVKYNLDYIVQ